MERAALSCWEWVLFMSFSLGQLWWGYTDHRIEFWLLPPHWPLSALPLCHGPQIHMPVGSSGNTPGGSSAGKWLHAHCLSDGWEELEKVPESKGWVASGQLHLLLSCRKEGPRLLDSWLFFKKKQKDGYFTFEMVLLLSKKWQGTFYSLCWPRWWTISHPWVAALDPTDCALPRLTTWGFLRAQCVVTPLSFRSGFSLCLQCPPPLSHLTSPPHPFLNTGSSPSWTSLPQPPSPSDLQQPSRSILFPSSLNSVHTTEEVLHWNALGCDPRPSLPLACKTHFIPLHILGALCNEQHQEWPVLIEIAHRIKSSHKLPYLPPVLLIIFYPYQSKKATKISVII